MHGADKLETLLRAREVAVEDATRNLRKVESVLEARRQKCEELGKKKSRLLAQLNELRGSARLDALRVGNVNMVASVTHYVKRLVQQVSGIEGLLAERQEEYRRAQEHLAMAHEDLVQARVEKGKVEKLISNRRQSEYLAEEAREETLLDEVNSARARGTVK